MKKLLLTLVFIAFAGLSYATEPAKDYFFKSVGHGDGLLNSVYSIYKFPQKDAWIGTPRGLYRFDGYNLSKFDSEYFNERTVYKLFEDSEERFWALTDRGAYVYDAGADEFGAPGLEGGASGGASGSASGGAMEFPAYSYFVNHADILFGGNGKIWRYEYARGEISLFNEFKGGYKDFVITSIFRLPELHAILCTGPSGSLVVDDATGTILRSELTLSENIFASAVDSKGQIWLAIYNKGIRVYDASGRYLKTYNVANGFLKNNIVLCMEEKDGKMWAGTDGGGISIIDSEAGRSEFMVHTAGDKTSFPSNSVRTLYLDHHNNMWAGSVRDGIICVIESGIKTYPDTFPGGDTGLSNPTVLSVFQETGSPYIWIGTDGEGINRYNQTTKKFRHYPTTYGHKIASIASFSENKLILSVFSEGLFLMDKRDGSIENFTLSDPEVENQARGMGRTINLMNDEDGGLILLGSSVYRWDSRRGAPVEIEISGERKGSGFFLPVGTSQGAIYVHNNNSIYEIPKGDRHAYLLATLPNGRINSVDIDASGEIWIASSRGLHKCTASGRKISDSIANTFFESASSVIKDSKNRIWIGAAGKLFSYSSDDGKFSMFGESDGAASNEYIGKAKLLSSEGNIYLGGVQGLVRIDKDYIINRTEVPGLYLKQFSVDGTTLPVDDESSVDVPMGAKTIDIKISTEESDFFRDKKYRFSIDGNKLMTYETDFPEFMLRPMPPAGNHDLYVSCTTRGGDWTKPVLLVSFNVPEVWYKTTWFMLLVVLVLISIVASYVYALIARQKHQAQVALREQEKRDYEKRLSFLNTWGNELRNPLTLVLGPIKKVLTEMDGSEEHYLALRRVYRHSKRVRDTLNIMLDLQSMEDGKTTLNISKAGFNDWVNFLAADYADEAAARDIKLTVICDPKIHEASFDARKCDLVLSTLINNTIIHGAKNDIVIVKTALMESGMVRVSVSGQSTDDKNVDADNLYTQESGTGLAMAYAKIIIELHKGNVGAFNNDRGGITAWFEIPTELSSEEIAIGGKDFIGEVMGESAPEAVKFEGKAYDTTSTKLLLVDDSRDLLAFFRNSLEYNFAQIQTASNEEEAIAAVRETMPDIIVCDVNMPGGTGYDFCLKLKASERYGHIPVILLTTSGEEQSAKHGYGVGADAVLGKPFEIDTLYELICSQLRRKTSIQKRYMDSTADDLVYKSAEEQFIIAVNKIVMDNLDNPELGVDMLCQGVGTSRAVLYSKLKAIAGTGANEYISKIRMNKAIFLIDNTDLPFAEIAVKTGYASASYFSTAFKQATGMTPSQYKMNKNK